MPGVPRIIVARPGYSALTTTGKDLAFSSDYNLGKIARAKKFTSASAAVHGVPYTPKIMSMREVTTNQFAWGGICSVDGTNVTPVINTHYTSYTTWATANDVATWAYIFIDPLVTGTYKKDMTGKPALIVGDDVSKNDYEQKIHSGYDTFKVHSTGRLTINASEFDPGSGGGAQTLTATVNHGLGYVPMFAPFVPFETEREAYLQWNGQYNSHTWTLGTTYYTGQDAANEEDYETWYTCKLTHTAAAANKPGSGANWTTYWDLYVAPDSYDTYVNKLEDQKYIYGGAEVFNQSFIKYYANATQLVLELTRSCYPESLPYYEYTPCPAEDVYVDYTIFYNKANEEFSLL
jgi:hypothetical protein